MTLLETLSRWVAGVQAADLPREVRNRAGLCLLDYLGLGLGANDLSTPAMRAAARQLVDLLRAEDAARDCLVLGFSERLSAGNAALINSLLGYGTSMDDTAGRSMSHTACAVIPAVLAVSQRYRSAGADAVAAIVAGYETMVRIGRAIMPSHARRGFHVTATTAPFGAAAAAARLLRLDGPSTASALAIAGNFGAGVQESMFRAAPAAKLTVGRGVQGGIMAALLAQTGMRGAPAFLEGPEGFLRAGADETRPELVTRRLGEEYEILGVGFKFHNGCRHWHAAVDAAVKLRKEHGLKAEQVEHVHLYTYGEALRMDVERPRNVDEARFSTPYVLAHALLGKDVIGSDLYTPEEMSRPEVQALMERVGLSLDPAFEARYPEEWPAAMEIRTRDGRALRAELSGPVGEPGNLDPEQIVLKFRALASRRLADGDVRLVQSLAGDLERLPDLTALVEALGRAAPLREGRA